MVRRTSPQVGDADGAFPLGICARFVTSCSCVLLFDLSIPSASIASYHNVYAACVSPECRLGPENLGRVIPQRLPRRGRSFSEKSRCPALQNAKPAVASPLASPLGPTTVALALSGGRVELLHLHFGA